MALKFADEREGDFANGNRVFARLDINVSDAGRAMMNDEFGELIVMGAKAAEITVAASHAAVMTILAAIIGNLDYCADENFFPETVARGLRSPLMKFLLGRRISRSQDLGGRNERLSHYCAD